LSLAEVFGFDKGLIQSTSIADAGLKAPRPRNTSLNTAKVSQPLGQTMPDILSGLLHFKSLRGFHDLAKAEV
jgi:dTDP-4-dehydrorhamnose reductase